MRLVDRENHVDEEDENGVADRDGIVHYDARMNHSIRICRHTRTMHRDHCHQEEVEPC